MLQQVVLQTAVPYVLNIDSVDPDDLIVVESISGLGAADVTLFTGSYSRNGGYYQGRRSGSRFPVFNLKLNPNYKDDVEVSDIREMLYDMFLEPSVTDELQVVLKDDRKPDRYFIGVTEKLPADIFERETKAQVSMVCVNPFLLSVAEVNESDPAGWVSTNIDYEGSAKTGLDMTFEVKTAVNQMVIDINGTKMTLQKPSGNFAVGDMVVINAIDGERAIQWGPNETALVDSMTMLSAGSRWVQLKKGINTVKTYGTVEADGKVALMNYRYRAAWWGI